MKIAFDLYLDDVVRVLCVAAGQDDDLLDRNLNKTEIKELCQKTIRDHGLYRDGWSDGLSETEEATVNGWAYAQARKYTW